MWELNDSVTVGAGHDTFVFEQTTLGTIGAVTITGFDPHKDGLIFSNQFVASVGYHENAQGNVVVSVDNNPADAITLLGVHACDLYPGNFQFSNLSAGTADPFQVSGNSAILGGDLRSGSTFHVTGNR